MSFDPDDTRWAERAAAVVATLPAGTFTVGRSAEFMNPWHDEIGRFAPKGTGSTSFPKRSGDKHLRTVEIPDNVANAAVVETAQVIVDLIEGGEHPFYIDMRRVQMREAFKDADKDLVNELIKPADAAAQAGELEEARRLLDLAHDKVFHPFDEEFKIPPPEKVEVTTLYNDPKTGLASYYTVTPEGNTITFKNKGHQVDPDQVQTILSAATTAARAGNLTDVEQLDIEVAPFWNSQEMRYEDRVMGFVNANPTDTGTTEHRTLHLTPQLIEGNFDADGITPQDPDTETASAALTDSLRTTVLHEFGHISLFENAIVREGDNGKEWFDSSMQRIADETPMTEIPLMSDYATSNTVEMHAEAFAEWTNTGGTTNNPWVRRLADVFHWSAPAQPKATATKEPALAAAGGPAQEPTIPVWLLPTEPFTVIDTVDGPRYELGEPTPPPPSQETDMAIHNPWLDEEGKSAPTSVGRQFRLVAHRPTEFANPWHDEIGRFAPKGTGHRYIKGVGDVDDYLAAHPREPGEAIFVWHGRLVDGLPPAAKHALLFEIRERYEPVDFIAAGMKKWRADHNLPEPQVDISEVPADQPKAYAVARAFEEMPDQSTDPQVQAAFDDFKRQNQEMWDFMTAPESEGGLGVKVTFWTNNNPQEFGVGPYPDATAQAEDLRNNHHIFLEAALGGEHQATMTQDEYDQFRAVHDVFGHAGIGSGFDRHGEYQAYLVHASMYTGEGQKAMASEYHGVNSAAWSGEPGTPGTGKSLLLPDVLVENPWDETGALRPPPTIDELERVLPSGLPRNLVAAIGVEQHAALHIDQRTADGIAYLVQQAGIEHPFAQMYDASPFHHVPFGQKADAEMTTMRQFRIEFANPWHDEEGKFAPKGAGTKSDGIPDTPAAAAEAPLDVKPGGNQSTGVDAKALADQVINGGDIVVNAIDADDVIRNFADAPQDVVDLTAVTVEGAPNMFSQMRESGRVRTEMPQITPDVQQEWFDTLRQEGIGFVSNNVDPASLAATQSELNGKKVGGMINSMENGSMSLQGDALLVSSDGHILDGHHRWAAAAAMSADCGGCIKIPVIVIDLPITKLVPYGLAWTDARGIPRAGVGTPSKKKAAAGMSPWSFTMDQVGTFTNFMEGGTPVPEGEYPKFATDAEDGITDADMVGLPQGDGSLRDANGNTTGEQAAPPAETAATAAATIRQFRVEFANPWHDEQGRFAPKGVGRQVRSIARSIRNSGDRAMADDIDGIAADIESGRLDQSSAVEVLQRIRAELESKDLGDPSLNNAYEDIDYLLKQAKMSAASGVEFANPWHDEVGKFAPKGTGTKAVNGVAVNEVGGIPVASTSTSGADVAAMASDVLAGKGVTVTAADVDDVLVAFANEKSVVDMTLISVTGSDTMFSEMRDNGVPRAQMPQIPVEKLGDFQQKLRDAGIDFAPEDIDPRELKATQSELNGQKVGAIIRDLRAGEFDLTKDPLWVSNDGHVLDGHHRWAGAAAISSDCGGCIDVPIIRVDVPMSQLLSFANDYNANSGIEKEAIDAISPHLRKKSPASQAAAMSNPPPSEGSVVYGMATDEADGITDDDVKDLPHGDGSAFADQGTVASVGEFMNPWHDEIGRFAPKGTGTKASVPKIERDANGKIIPSPEAKALAADLYADARRREPELTRRLSQLVGDKDPVDYGDGPPPPQLYGYEARLKTMPGIADKIERLVDQKKIPREVAATPEQLKDLVRYTVHFTQDEFGPRAQDVIEQLAQENARVTVKNTWPPESGDAYKGVNVRVTTNDGFTYEIQFHTPESQAVKDQMHGMYFEARSLPAGHPRRVELETEMARMSAELDPPTGAYEVTQPRQRHDADASSAATVKRQWSLHDE